MEWCRVCLPEDYTYLEAVGLTSAVSTASLVSVLFPVPLPVCGDLRRCMVVVVVVVVMVVVVVVVVCVCLCACVRAWRAWRVCVCVCVCV